MSRLQVGDRIRLYGGYDFEPAWLQGRKEYYAKVISFFDKGVEGREGDERLSASIEFEEEISYKNISGKYGFIMGRWQGQKWEKTGVVHVHITKNLVTSSSDTSKENSVWAESHASYEVVS